jgi:hypothetical protein
LPLISQGKFRCKKREDIQDFGKGFAPKSTPITKDAYLEWQIGYDTIIGNDEKPTKLNTEAFVFTGANGKLKHPYELSEIVFYMCKQNIITKEEIKNIILKINNISDFLQEKFIIEVKKEGEIILNDLKFLSSSTKLPTFIIRNDNNLLIEIMIQKQQYATDVQPMLYLDIPVDAFSNRDNIINHTSTETPLGHLIFDSSQKFLIFNILLCFGMCSAAHNHDIKEIIKVIMKNAF